MSVCPALNLYSGKGPSLDSLLKAQSELQDLLPSFVVVGCFRAKIDGANKWPPVRQESDRGFELPLQFREDDVLLLHARRIIINVPPLVRLNDRPSTERLS